MFATGNGKKELSNEDAKAFNDNFHVFDPFDSLDLVLLNVIGLAKFFLLRGGSEIIYLKRTNIVYSHFPVGHKFEGTRYFSLRMFDKTHKLSSHQVYIRELEKVLRCPIFKYEALCEIEMKKPDGDVLYLDTGFALNLEHVFYVGFFLEHLINHMDPKQVCKFILIILT